jgi:hypothetical protein
MLLSLKPKVSSTLSVRGSSGAYEDPYMPGWFVVLYGCPVPCGISPYGGALAGGITKPGVAVYGGG